MQAYTLEPFERWSSRNEALALSLFIDDLLSGLTRADPDEVVQLLVQGAAGLHEVITRDLHCNIAVAKSLTIANSASLRSKLAKALGRYAGVVASSGRTLAIDYAVGNLRKLRSSRPVLKERIGKLKAE